MQGVSTRKQELLGVILKGGHYSCYSQNSLLSQFIILELFGPSYIL